MKLLKEVARYLGVSHRTLCRWRQSGHFPPPILPFAKPRWTKQAVDEWIEQRIRQSKAEHLLEAENYVAQFVWL